MKREVTKINGRKVRRPRGNHPDSAHWMQLRELRKALQTVDGSVHCATCWDTQSERNLFDLHHRHYDNWGQERIEDVVLLCRPCHEAITNRIRLARYAAGDDTVSIASESIVYERRKHITVRESVTVQKEAPVCLERFRPAPR